MSRIEPATKTNGAEPEEEQLVAALEEHEHRGDEAERDAAHGERVRRDARPGEAGDRPRRHAARAGRVALLECRCPAHAADRSRRRLRALPARRQAVAYAR